MSHILYEQYKDALRRGHVAALRGRLHVAVAAYEAAAAIAPDRALPHASLGTVLLRLGRVDAAEAAFAEALLRAPDDETALRRRAEMRAEQGSRLDAARDYEALADSLDRAGRLVDACDAARRALELAESRARRRAVERLAGLLREQDADPSAAEALRLALLLLEPMHAAAPVAESGPNAPAAGGRTAAVTGETVDADTLEPGTGIEPSEVDHPRRDPISALVEAETLIDAGDVAAARAVLLPLAAQQRSLGRLDAALDACLVLMAVDPSDAALQLEIAANQLARGWSEVAAEKVRLIARLAELEGDSAATAAVAGFAALHGLGVSQPMPAALGEVNAAG